VRLVVPAQLIDSRNGENCLFKVDLEEVEGRAMEEITTKATNTYIKKGRGNNKVVLGLWEERLRTGRNLRKSRAR